MMRVYQQTGGPGGAGGMPPNFGQGWPQPGAGAGTTQGTSHSNVDEVD
jgi:hypothetical protein